MVVSSGLKCRDIAGIVDLQLVALHRIMGFESERRLRENLCHLLLSCGAAPTQRDLELVATSENESQHGCVIASLRVWCPGRVSDHQASADNYQQNPTFHNPKRYGKKKDPALSGFVQPCYDVLLLVLQVCGQKLRGNLIRHGVEKSLGIVYEGIGI